MPEKKIPDDELLDRLTRVFRLYGFEGASLRRLTEVSGLKRASLYHRFPGGKEEMADAVLDRVDQLFGDYVLAPLRTADPPAERVAEMARRLAEFYAEGTRSCVLDTLSMGGEHEGFGRHIRQSITAWRDALTGLAEEAGLEPKEARRRADEAVLRIQGALVVSRASGNTEPFQQVLTDLPDLLTKKSKKL